MKFIKRFELFESKHDTLVTQICKEIMSQIKEFMNSGLETDNIDLPSESTGDDYYITTYHGQEQEFIVELFLQLDTTVETYKIDADSPGDMDEHNLVVIIHLNPENYPNYLDKVYHNLVYTVRHEYEHLLQVYTDYQNVIQFENPNFTDDLKFLMQPQEIEPQVKGYYLRSKKEKKFFDEVIMADLEKYEKTGQVTFERPENKQILLNKLIQAAKDMKLPIKLSNQ